MIYITPIYVIDDKTKNIYKMNGYKVFTDGACSNNGKANAVAGIGIFFKEDDVRNVSRRVSGKQTNNVAELTAIIDSFPIIEADLRKGLQIKIVTDSEYAIRCAKEYGRKCASQNWTKNIPNKHLVRSLYEKFVNFSNVEFVHVKAHTKATDELSIGNMWADKLANNALDMTEVSIETAIVEIPREMIVKKSTTKKVYYLNVHYSQKEDIKLLGGRWDPHKKKWYVNGSNEAIAYILKYHYS